jgi:hypothetical protein
MFFAFARCGAAKCSVCIFYVLELGGATRLQPCAVSGGEFSPKINQGKFNLPENSTLNVLID